jgi:hypothetical protein
MAFKTFQEESRDRYGRDFCGDKSQYATGEELKKGALLRIADALEKMTVDHDELVRQRDNYKRGYEKEKERRRKLERSIAGLRGYIKRLEKRTKKG